jgi:hypothetical protein
MSASALKEYLATLPAAKPAEMAPQFVSNSGADLLEEKPAKVGAYRPPKVIRGLDVATFNDFAKDPSVLPTLPGLPLDDMTKAIQQLSRRVEDLNAKAVMFRRPPMFLQADLKPEFKMSDLVAAFQQSRRMDQELLFREGLLKEGITPEEIRRLEAQERIARALGRVGAAQAAPVAAAVRGRQREAAPSRPRAPMPIAPAGAVEAALAEGVRRGPGRPRRVAMGEERPIPPEPVPKPIPAAFSRQAAREGSVLARLAIAQAEERAAVEAARAGLPAPVRQRSLADIAREMGMKPPGGRE